MQAMTDSSNSVYRCLWGTLTVYTPHKAPEMVSSAPLCGSVSTASPLSYAVSPSRHLASPSGLSNNHSIVVTAPPRSLFDARAASAPSLGPRSASAHIFAPPPPPSHLPPSLPHSLPPSARHTSRAVLTFVVFLHAFHVLSRSPSRRLPGCSLISCTFLEASAGLRC